MMFKQKDSSPKTKIFDEVHVRTRMFSIFLVLCDIVIVNISYLLALLIRFDFYLSTIPEHFLKCHLQYCPIYTIVAIGVFCAFRIYRCLWRYVSLTEISCIVPASLLASLLYMGGMLCFFERMPISYFIFGAMFQVVFIVCVRYAYRIFRFIRNRWEKKADDYPHALVIGAGEAGLLLLRELKNSQYSHINPVCLIDDDEKKWGCKLYGIPVVGGRNKMKEAVEQYRIKHIFFAIPSVSAKVKKEFLDICQETDCDIKVLPGVYQLANGEVLLQKLRPIAVEDLLGREPIQINSEEIFGFLSGKIVLVTGGGGSIGSELCRQIASHQPKQLIIVDAYENNAYDIEQELRQKYKEDLDLVVLIASVRDSRRINDIFERYHPEIVFHAAAHKHVPLMENNPNEAIKNNVIGTYHTARAALLHGAKRFVLISTDKAVNPTNIMGASKRLCEMVIQSMNAVSNSGCFDLLPSLGKGEELLEPRKTDSYVHTQFVAVRFGNVLGSNGSVIPLFQKQIEAGGPVTVTHPNIVRYFMTIPEAVGLVLQAGIYALGGEIFVLDMGEPVKIDTLARNLIRLSGYTPDVDIKIVYSGLRPGEKLYEEKLMAEEGIQKTDNDLIYIGRPIDFDTTAFFSQLTVLERECKQNSDRIVSLVQQIVTTFHPVGQHPEGYPEKQTEKEKCSQPSEKVTI